MSPEVQNRGTSGPTKRTHVLQKLKKKLVYKVDIISRYLTIITLLPSDGGRDLEKITEQKY